MVLDFVELKDSFYTVFEDPRKIYIEIVRKFSGVLDVDELWNNCMEIEKKWEFYVQKQQDSIKWLFFGDYPTSVSSYIFNHPKYGNKVMVNHLERSLLLFDLIPLTISYKNLKKNLELEAYINIFNGFAKFREQKWNLIRPFVDKHTKFCLTYTRQNEYKSHLLEECRKIFNFDVKIESWSRDYGTSSDIYDRIEKMILIFE